MVMSAQLPVSISPRIAPAQDLGGQPRARPYRVRQGDHPLVNGVPTQLRGEAGVSADVLANAHGVDVGAKVGIVAVAPGCDVTPGA